MTNFVLILLMFLSTAGPATVIGFVGAAAIKAVARNPAASAKIFIAMILSFFFAEAIAVIALFIVSNFFNR